MMAVTLIAFKKLTYNNSIFLQNYTNVLTQKSLDIKTATYQSLVRYTIKNAVHKTREISTQCRFESKKYSHPKNIL